MNRPIWPPGTVFCTMRSFGVPMYFAASSTCSGVVMSSAAPASRYVGAGDVRRLSVRPKPTNLPLAKRFSLNNSRDHLEIPAPRQIDRIFVPALERLLFREIGADPRCARRDRCDPGCNARLGMHVLPALQHELALHQAAAERDQFLVERHRVIGGPCA